MASNKTAVLKHDSIMQKIKRIAYQIYEFNYSEKEIVFVAIENQGVILAKRIKPILEDISGMNVSLCSLKINKKSPLNNVSLDGDGEILTNKSVILIDDVLNSGRTLIYAARHILNYKVKRLTTVVLVDRLHRKFPIKADFVGLTLSTTLQDHILVEFKEGNDTVYLV